MIFSVMRMLGLHHPWLKHPSERGRGLPPPLPTRSYDDARDGTYYRDSRDIDKEWANRDSFLLNRNHKGNPGQFRGQKELDEYFALSRFNAH